MAEYHTDYSVFVGDLAYEVDDALLEQTFRTYYPTTKHAKVMVDPVTGRSRGFGFVRFTNEAERDRAMQEMNGVYIGSKQIRCSLATQKPKPGSAAATGQGSAPGAGPVASAGGASNTSTATVAAGSRDAGSSAAEVNTTLFIGGLSMSVSEAELHALFARCGEIVYTKIPQGKGCGFVQFVSRPAAEYALETLNGTILGGMPIRISWGKSSRPPPPAGGHSHHAPSHYPPPAGYYGGHPPAYDPYGGYAYPAYDPYGGYGYGVDPYAGYPGYGVQPAAGGPGMAAAAAASAAAAAHNGPAPGTPGAIQPVLYDPLAPVNPEKMNMAYMHRQVPYMTGAYVRVPIGMPMRAPPI